MLLNVKIYYFGSYKYFLSYIFCFILQTIKDQDFAKTLNSLIQLVQIKYYI